MALTVREALDLPVFAEAQVEVLASSGNLARVVRWVHVAELPDIAPLLKGGELLLTTGMGLTRGASQRRRYLEQLADAGVAGVVVELGRNFQQMPDEMIRTAEMHGIPLIALGHETRFVEITEQVHRAILSRQYEILNTVETINREFTNLVLGGAGVQQILHELSQAVVAPVVLEDAAHQVVGFAGQDGELIASVLSQWGQHSRTGHRDRGHAQ